MYFKDFFDHKILEATLNLNLPKQNIEILLINIKNSK